VGWSVNTVTVHYNSVAQATLLCMSSYVWLHRNV